MRNLYRCIVTASYDRGIEHTLKMWPDVINAVPKAELHIFYGWQLFDQFYKDNPGSMMWKANMVKMMKQPGIFEHGRVPQPQLAEEYKKSGIYVYSTHFGEINCISALKAQYYGCEPVVINYAALKETVHFGHRIEGDIYDDKVKEEFKSQLIDALNNPMSDEKRAEMSEWAKQFEWSEIAKKWEVEFKNGL